MDLDRDDRGARSRSAALERVIFALQLEPRRLQRHPFASPLAQVAARALRVAAPPTLPERDRRYLNEAEAAAPVVADRSSLQARALLGAVAARWAARTDGSRESVDAALVATTALAALVPHESRGELARSLAELAEAGGLDSTVRGLARDVASGRPISETALARDLALILDQIDASAS